MSARKWLAAAGAGLLTLQLVLTAQGYDSAASWLKELLSTKELIAASVAVELRGFQSSTPAQSHTPAPQTPAPLPSIPPVATPAPSSPSPLPEVLETSVTGGMTIKNATPFDVSAAQLLADGPSLILPRDQPQILIIHTHSSEAYTMDEFDQYEPSDTSRTQDANYNVIRVGDELTACLQEYGLRVIHDRGVYDYPSYTGSYNRTAEAIAAYLEQYPSLSMVIDLHRDAIGDDDVVYKTVAEQEGLPSAQAMLVVGSCGSGLEHPHWEENLRLAAYLQNAVNAVHPSLMRPINLVNERYNQQLTTGSLILEVGSSGNTLQEALTAVRLFAEGVGPALAKQIQ